MKTKLILFFTLIVVVSFAACGVPTGERTCSQCNLPSFRTVIVRYQNGSTRSVGTGQNGCVTYTSRNGGDCGFVDLVGNNFGFFLTASPGGFDLNAPPSSVTISGQGMSSAYGMPRVEYFDGDGYQVGTVSATWISGDGTQIIAPTPDLSYAYSGTYQIIVTNAQAGGFYIDRVGGGTMSCWGRDRPDSDGDGVYDDSDCYPWDAWRWDCETGGCGQQNSPGHPQMEQPMPCNEY